MTNRHFHIILCLFICSIFSTACSGIPRNPKGTFIVSDLVAFPVYGSTIRIYGEVSMKGELFCPCFLINSGGESIEARYDILSLNMVGINNGDSIIATGELVASEIDRLGNIFVVIGIEKVK